MKQEDVDDVSIDNLASRMSEVEHNVTALQPLKKLIGMDDSVRQLISDVKYMMKHAKGGGNIADLGTFLHTRCVAIV